MDPGGHGLLKTTTKTSISSCDRKTPEANDNGVSKVRQLLRALHTKRASTDAVAATLPASSKRAVSQSTVPSSPQMQNIATPRSIRQLGEGHEPGTGDQEEASKSSQATRAAKERRFTGSQTDVAASTSHQGQDSATSQYRPFQPASSGDKQATITTPQHTSTSHLGGRSDLLHMAVQPLPSISNVRLSEPTSEPSTKKRKITKFDAAEQPVMGRKGRRTIDYGYDDLRRDVLVNQASTATRPKGTASTSVVATNIVATPTGSPCYPAPAARPSDQTSNPAKPQEKESMDNEWPSSAESASVRPAAASTIRSEIKSRSSHHTFPQQPVSRAVPQQRQPYIKPNSTTAGAFGGPAQTPRASTASHPSQLPATRTIAPQQPGPARGCQKPDLQIALPPRLSFGASATTAPANPPNGRHAAANTTPAAVKSVESTPRAGLRAPLPGFPSGTSFLMNYQYNLDSPEQMLVDGNLEQEDFDALLARCCPGATRVVGNGSAVTSTTEDHSSKGVAQEMEADEETTEDEEDHQGPGLGKTIPKRWEREGPEESDII